MVVSSYIIGHFISRKEGWNVMFVYDSCIPSLTFYILFDNLFLLMVQNICKCNLKKWNRTPASPRYITSSYTSVLAINVITFLITEYIELIFVSPLEKSWPFI